MALFHLKTSEAINTWSRSLSTRPHLLQHTRTRLPPSFCISLHGSKPSSIARSHTRANRTELLHSSYSLEKIPVYEMSSSLVLHARFGAIRRNIPLCHTR
uniref:Uncharacterized protein n=1 Tax=Hyaloperonospora arabidopsidis (strain Emoy2) TaxID=559515 RepID=M4C5C7_HYAAE